MVIVLLSSSWPSGNGVYTTETVSCGSLGEHPAADRCTAALLEHTIQSQRRNPKFSRFSPVNRSDVRHRFSY